MEEKEKSLEELEADISALARRIMLMEEENKKAEQCLADTVIKLALSSKVSKYSISFGIFIHILCQELR